MTTLIDITLTLTVGILIGVACTRWWAHNNLVYHLDLYREMIEAEMETREVWAEVEEILAEGRSK